MMIGDSGVIFELSSSHRKKKHYFEGLNGNSGVGQASEFPFKLSKKLLVSFSKTLRNNIALGQRFFYFRRHSGEANKVRFDRIFEKRSYLRFADSFGKASQSLRSFQDDIKG